MSSLSRCPFRLRLQHLVSTLWDLEPEGTWLSLGGPPAPSRSGQARNWGPDCEGVLCPGGHGGRSGPARARPRQGKAARAPPPGPAPRMPHRSLCSCVCPLVSVPLPVAKGSADSRRFPRVFRGYAERKRRKRENDSASVIQR